MISVIVPCKNRIDKLTLCLNSIKESIAYAQKERAFDYVAEDWILEGIKVLEESKALVVQGIPWLFQQNENPYMGDQEQKLYEIMFSTYLYDTNKTKMTDSRNLLMNRDITKVLGDEVFAEKMAKATAESRVFGNLLWIDTLTRF